MPLTSEDIRPLPDTGGSAEPAEVLVVGSGPTGLTAACELLRRGVRARLIDRAEEPSPFPKALLLWPRTLDLLEDLGALTSAREAGVDIRRFRYYSSGEPLVSFDFPEHLAPLCLPQNETERVLTARLLSLGGRVERGVRLLAFDGMDFSGDITATDGVTAVLEHADGTVERYRAPYVLGADGAGSAVRAQIGTGFGGGTYTSAFALVDCRVEGELPPDEALYYQSPEGALVVVALPNGVFRFFASLPPGEKADLELLQRIADEQGPGGVRLVDPVWETVFRVHRRHAEEFQRGRVFLAGDAAHIHSPAGGQGLNTGMQDAQNIAWKLAEVVNGRAPHSLLYTYQEERRDVARQVVRDTDIQTRGWMVRHPLQTRLRDTAYRALRPSLERHYLPVMAGYRFRYSPARGTQEPAWPASCHATGLLAGATRVGHALPRALATALGIGGAPSAGEEAAPVPGWVLAVSGGPDLTERLARTVANRPGIAVRELTAHDAREHRLCPQPGYHLVRPDGYVAAHGHRSDGRRLRAELNAHLGRAARTVATAVR
ncbi:FAD-dependent monooxygenase [Nocardiopsis halotolerans]|uniref:FAD-dependent monooxygenase n=1 Tax=Nocardiopsis halotolerans TaxID=124252 RepID=UPI00034B820A|nr:FAD-dependent monooxygenase [Nocardiopsis halotolerans]